MKQFQEIADEMLPDMVYTPRSFIWLVGNAVEKAFEPLVARLNQTKGLSVELIALNSQYWGQEITVTGLLTGQDLINSLEREKLQKPILLPSLMLKHDETKFLDDLTVEEVSQKLKVPLIPVSGVEELMAQCVA